MWTLESLEVIGNNATENVGYDFLLVVCVNLFLSHLVH